MRIDRTHKPWAIATFAALFVSLTFYALYARSTESPPSGGSVPGLIFGISGYGLMIYVALLGLRKKFPVRRVGRASTWMRGHLWLGFLSLPLLLFHAGFAANGPLTAWLMTLLIVTVATGAAGAIIQHYLPTLMSRLVPLETIYEEIPRVTRQLQCEADDLVDALLPTAGQTARFPWGARSAPHPAAKPALDQEALERVQHTYRETIRPFLYNPDRVKNACSFHDQAAALFALLRTYVPSSVHKTLADLESICEEQRQLKRQKLMYQILHGWLLVHVPLSLALLLLGAIHAVVALWY